MGLYERSLHTHVKIKGSNLKAIRALAAMGETLGPESLDGASLILSRELYSRLISLGYYEAAPRSGRDRRTADRRQGDRRAATMPEIIPEEDL